MTVRGGVRRGLMTYYLSAEMRYEENARGHVRGVGLNGTAWGGGGPVVLFVWV